MTDTKRRDPYVLTIADRHGALAESYAESFDELLAIYDVLRSKHPQGVVFSFGNVDRADMDDGLTDDEQERLELHVSGVTS